MKNSYSGNDLSTDSIFTCERLSIVMYCIVYVLLTLMCGSKPMTAATSRTEFKFYSLNFTVKYYYVSNEA